MPTTREGRVAVVDARGPSWPFAFSPHDHTCLFVSTARACCASEMWEIAGKPDTAAGVGRLIARPWPSWPWLSLPHANTPPEALRASVCEREEERWGAMGACVPVV